MPTYIKATNNQKVFPLGVQHGPNNALVTDLTEGKQYLMDKPKFERFKRRLDRMNESDIDARLNKEMERVNNLK